MEAVKHALSYLTQQRDFFSVEVGLFKDEPFKPFIELLFLWHLLPQRFKKNNKALEELKAFIDQELSQLDLTPIATMPATLSALAIIEQYYQDHGESHLKPQLSCLAQKHYPLLVEERVPYRLLDVAYSLEAVGVTHHFGSLTSLYEETVLSKGLPIFYFSPAAMYSVTHTLFYLTDMGRKPKLPQSIPDLCFLLRSLLGDRLLEKDFDILSELILDIYFLGLEDNFTALFDLAFAEMVKFQQEDGSFPPPLPSKARDPKGRFRDHYHTTLVCLGALVWKQELNLENGS